MCYSVILDLGGVCVFPRMGLWHLPVNYRAVLGSRADSARTPEYTALTQELFYMLDERHFVDSLDDEEIMVRKYYAEIGRRMGWNLTDDEVNALAHSEVYDEARFAIFPDTVPFLKMWRNLTQIGILTNALPSVGKYLINSGLNALVSQSVVSTLVGAGKPDREAYEIICRRMDAAPESCIFVDDLTENLIGARKCGMRAILMRRDVRKPVSDWDGEVIRNFKELDKLLCEEICK